MERVAIIVGMMERQKLHTVKNGNAKSEMRKRSPGWPCEQGVQISITDLRQEQ